VTTSTRWSSSIPHGNSAQSALFPSQQVGMVLGRAPHFFHIRPYPIPGEGPGFDVFLSRRTLLCLSLSFLPFFLSMMLCDPTNELVWLPGSRVAVRTP